MNSASATLSFLPYLTPFGTGLTGGVKYLALTYACMHALYIMLTNKVNYSTIQTLAHYSQGLWLYSRGEWQVPSFSCRSLNPEQMLLSIFIYYTKGTIATIKRKQKVEKSAPNLLPLTPQRFSYRARPYALLFFINLYS